MIKKILFALGLLCAAAPLQAADEKIDPATYICAELVAASVDGQPPIYEGLQLDGYLSGKTGQSVADSETLPPMLIAVSDSCSAKPGDKAVDHWKELRVQIPWPGDGSWRADKTTCSDYTANPDDGSGFVIWLDAYNRGKNNTGSSILSSQETLDNFLKACAANPKKLMLDVLKDSAK